MRHESYLRDLCHTTVGIPGRPSLRSTEQGLLLVPFAHTAIMQNRAFSVVGPSLWNGLSLAPRLFPRIVSNSFYAHLKTFLFARAGILKFTRAKLSERKLTKPVESWSWQNCCS